MCCTLIFTYDIYIYKWYNIQCHIKKKYKSELSMALASLTQNIYDCLCLITTLMYKCAFNMNTSISILYHQLDIYTYKYDTIRGPHSRGIIMPSTNCMYMCSVPGNALLQAQRKGRYSQCASLKETRAKASRAKQRPTTKPKAQWTTNTFTYHNNNVAHTHTHITHFLSPPHTNIQLCRAGFSIRLNQHHSTATSASERLSVVLLLTIRPPISSPHIHIIKRTKTNPRSDDHWPES